MQPIIYDLYHHVQSLFVIIYINYMAVIVSLVKLSTTYQFDFGKNYLQLLTEFDERVLIVAETNGRCELFGKRVYQRPRKTKNDTDAIVRNLTELTNLSLYYNY